MQAAQQLLSSPSLWGMHRSLAVSPAARPAHTVPAPCNLKASPKYWQSAQQDSTASSTAPAHPYHTMTSASAFEALAKYIQKHRKSRTATLHPSPARMDVASQGKVLATHAGCPIFTSKSTSVCAFLCRSAAMTLVQTGLESWLPRLNGRQLDRMHLADRHEVL